ncbi:MAG: type II toxin-antitoxin system VapC family toxin [Acidobacteriota bacterium]
MALYLDTSCLLKLLFSEPESARVAQIIAAEKRVIVSSLGRLEALVRIRARRLSGSISAAEGRRLLRALDRLTSAEPFVTLDCPVTIFKDAERQLASGISRTCCRTLDRLHLAAALALEAKRLLTNDDAQARAAKALKLRVVIPR